MGSGQQNCDLRVWHGCGSHKFTTAVVADMDSTQGSHQYPVTEGGGAQGTIPV